MAEQFLEVQGITKNFGGVQALREVGFGVSGGEVVGLIGPNGAGKSTLFNVICGIKPTAGCVLFKGEDITGQRADDICHRGIARTFQLTKPFLDISVKDNVASAFLFGRNRHQISGLGEARAEAMGILQEVKLDHRGDALASELLFAERRRLELARALATGPELLLLDEVMAGLSTGESQEMLEILAGLRHKHGLTLLVIEHIMKVVMAICDRIVVLNYGSKLAEGTPQEVAHNKEVIAAYLGDEGA
jgi:branched-chain amino acid transport system ATP-binding protein